MTIFNGTMTLGDVFGLLLGELIINQLEWGWQKFVALFALILYMSGAAFYLCLREMPLRRPSQNSLGIELGEQCRKIK